LLTYKTGNEITLLEQKVCLARSPLKYFMKIGFISFAIPGHFNPMSALARQLQSRNHDVVMFSLPVIESLVRAADLPFVPFAEKEFPADKAGEILGTLSRLKGEKGLQFTVNLDCGN